jgi:hypothetical protein
MLWKLEKIGDAYTLTTDRIRSNLAVSDRSWLAEITGIGGKYGLERSFVPRCHDVYGNQDGEQTFGPLKEGTTYEYRQIWRGDSANQYSKGNSASGFFRIENGEAVEMSKTEIFEACLASQRNDKATEQESTE